MGPHSHLTVPSVHVAIPFQVCLASSRGANVELPRHGVPVMAQFDHTRIPASQILENDAA